MPTARELLEQADALMRRNRAADAEIPVLTDIVADARAPARGGPKTRERAGASRREALRETAGAPSDRTSRDERSSQRTTEPQSPAVRPTSAAAEPPVLIDAVEEVAVDIPAPPPEPAEAESSLWLGPDTVDPALHSITGPAPDTVSVVPPVKLLDAEPPPPEKPGFFDEPDPTVTRTLRAAGSAPTPAPAGSMPFSLVMDATVEPPLHPPSASDDERWRALAEQISMQVLQRIDLFTDTGLKAQLASHLEPIVAQASAELVEAINDHVGRLIRSYVAEAIEREIAQWRENNR
jgi:hypothetical protein